jgi:hypothetical protein
MNDTLDNSYIVRTCINATTAAITKIKENR